MITQSNNIINKWTSRRSWPTSSKNSKRINQIINYSAGMPSACAVVKKVKSSNRLTNSLRCIISSNPAIKKPTQVLWSTWSRIILPSKKELSGSFPIIAKATTLINMRPWWPKLPKMKGFLERVTTSISKVIVRSPFSQVRSVSIFLPLKSAKPCRKCMNLLTKHEALQNQCYLPHETAINRDEESNNSTNQV